MHVKISTRNAAGLCAWADKYGVEADVLADRIIEEALGHGSVSQKSSKFIEDVVALVHQYEDSKTLQVVRVEKSQPAPPDAPAESATVSGRRRGPTIDWTIHEPKLRKYFGMGYTNLQIATSLGLTTSAVRTRLGRMGLYRKK